MIADSIQTALGPELTEAVQLALQQHSPTGKPLELVAGNDGSYVPAEKYRSLKKQAGQSEALLSVAAAALKELGGSGSSDTLEQDLRQLAETMQQLQSSKNEETQRFIKTAALRQELMSRVHDPADLLPYFELEELELLQDGRLKPGWDKPLSALQQAKPYLFLAAESPAAVPQLTGARPAQPPAQRKSEEKQAGPTIF